MQSASIMAVPLAITPIPSDRHLGALTDLEGFFTQGFCFQASFFDSQHGTPCTARQCLAADAGKSGRLDWACFAYSLWFAKATTQELVVIEPLIDRENAPILI